MAEPRYAVVHISSAVVLADAARAAQVISAIERFPDAEVFHSEGGKIIVVLEGPTSRAVGDRLAEIALIDGVIAANLVYEQVESLESVGEGQ